MVVYSPRGPDTVQYSSTAIVPFPRPPLLCPLPRQRGRGKGEGERSHWLLFERPVNVGDVVQIGDASGVVERIGIRASIIRTTNGSEVIVPNGKLISERLTNWTLSNRQHGIELPIAVAQGADPNRVIALLERTAATHPLVAGDPPPQALVVKLGPDSLGCELRVWTDRSEQWMQIRSELAIAISAALTAEKIAIR